MPLKLSLRRVNGVLACALLFYSNENSPCFKPVAMTSNSIHSKTTAKASLKLLTSGSALLGLTFFNFFQRAQIPSAAAGAPGE